MLAVVSALGPTLHHTLIAVAIVWWPFYARIVRGEVRSIVSRSHVEAARMGGAGRSGSRSSTSCRDVRRAPRHRVARHRRAMLTLAGLSFLGLGSPPPAAELGAMSSRGLSYLFTSWWVPVFPALGVFVLTFVGNLAGDAVRDVVEG